MKITGFQWDSANTGHIAKHNVSPEEAEEVLCNRHLVRKSRAGTYHALGQTDEGRYLAVIFAIKPEGIARVVTARDMDDKERRTYRRERRS